MTFKNHIPWNKGKHWPEEIKIKISESMKDKPSNKHLSEHVNYTGYRKRETLSEEHRKKLSEAMRGNIPWNKGKTGIYSEEYRKKLSQRSKGNTYGAANKGRISERRGKTGIYTVETIIKMRESANRRWSKKSERKKQSIAKRGCIPWMKGRHHTQESKRKMSETKRAKKHGS
jgi:NUMOD3 motif